MTRRLQMAMTVLLVLGGVRPAAYLPLAVQVDGQATALRWKTMPVRWYASDQERTDVSPGALQASVGRAFDTWQHVSTADVSFAFAGFTSASPFDEDGLSVVGFTAEPDMDRVLGATSFVIDDVTGEIVEADIFFNSIFAWSTAETPPPDRFDLQAVATHEIGHFLGLAHSALGETELQSSGGRRVVASGAVMFPISSGPGNAADRTLQPDDVAGLSSLYPDATVRSRTGSIHGRVLLEGRPVFGAHVIAFDLTTGALVGGFVVNEEGEFQISRLRPGPHVVRVEPLDDADVEAFFDAETLEIGFRPAFYSRIVVVPAGGAAPRIDVALSPK